MYNKSHINHWRIKGLSCIKLCSGSLQGGRPRSHQHQCHMVLMCMLQQTPQEEPCDYTVEYIINENWGSTFQRCQISVLNEKQNVGWGLCTEPYGISSDLSSLKTSNNVPFLLLGMERGWWSMYGSMEWIYRTDFYIRNVIAWFLLSFPWVAHW